jgi:chromosome segregation ATPase
VQPLELSRLSGTLNWLEDETRTLKAALTRVQGQQEQVLGFLRDYADQVRVLQDAVTSVRTQLGQVATLDEAVKTLQGIVAQLRDTAQESAEASERRRKADQAETERLRAILAETWHRLDTLQSEVAPLVSKLQNLAEAQKRLSDALQSLNAAQDNFRGELAQFSQRLQASAERERRVDDRFGDVHLQLDALERRDETLSDQLKVLTDRLVQTEERMSAVLAEVEARHALEEQLQRLRVTVGRLEQHTQELETRTSEQARLLDETHRLTRQVDDRRAALATRIDEQAEAIARLRTELTELLAEYESLEEQHRVRLVTELQQQIREVRARVAKARGK